MPPADRSLPPGTDDDAGQTSTGSSPATETHPDRRRRSSGVAPALQPGETVAGRFRIVRLIGRGGMGEVYEADDLQLEERVAIKTIRADVLPDVRARERFRREIQLARKVTHVNVCRLFDLVLHETALGQEVPLLSMELLRGETLSDFLLRKPALDPAEALPLIRQIAAGLAAAHRAGVIHRDFKSANVILVPGPGDEVRAVVTDFGLARSIAPSAVGADGERSGTPAYMAPEQAEGKETTIASDVYAFGIVIYEMVTGALPFSGGTSPSSVANKRLTDEPLRPRAVIAGLDPRWEQVILRCLERDPADRFENADAIVAALTGDPQPSAAASSPARWGLGRRRFLVAAAGLGAVAALAGARVFWAPAAGVGPIVVAAPELARLVLDESWIGAAFQRQVINDLSDAWGVDAWPDVGSSAIEVRAVHTLIWRDADGRIRAAVSLPGASARQEVRGASIRELAQAAARLVAEGLIPSGSRRPNRQDLTQVGASDAEAWRLFRRARRAARMGQWEPARRLAREATERDPRFTIAWMELASSYNEVDPARNAALDKVMETGARADGLGAYSRLTVEFARSWRSGDEAGIVRAMEAADRLGLQGDDLLYFKTRQALMLFHRGEPEKGLPILEWIAEKWPHDAAAPKYLADYYLGSSEILSLPLAVRHGEQAVALAPEDVCARANLARALLLANDETRTRAHLPVVLKADPEEKESAFVGGIVNRVFALHMALGDREAAMADARRLLMGTGVRHAQGLAAVAAAQFGGGAFEDGLARLVESAAEWEALGMRNLAAFTYWEHAWQAYNLGRRREALGSLAQIHRLSTGSRHTHVAKLETLARLLETLARVEDASTAAGISAEFRRTIATLPAEGAWQPWRGYFELLLRYHLQDWTGVVEVYRELDARFHPLATTYLAARALEHLGRGADAAALYERLARHPNAWHQPYPRGAAWLRLGRLREKTGDAAGARAAYESLLALWDQAPRDMPEIREAEGRLLPLRHQAARSVVATRPSPE